VLVSLQLNQRSSVRGFIDGALHFHEGSQLIFREFLDTTRDNPRLIYTYHYQNATQELIFRYDNAAHRPALTQPTHKHSPDGIETASPPTLAGVLDEILQILGS